MPMTESSTQENLIRFIYNETSSHETESIFDQIQQDVTVEKHLDSYINIKQMLDTLVLNPKRASVDFILKKSREYSTAKVVC